MLLTFIHQIWYSSFVDLTRAQKVLFYILLPLSYIYLSVVYIRRYLYKFGILPSYSMPVPVVIIGNIVAGGCGKTPIVIKLCQELVDRNIKIAIVCRGYGVKINKPIIINDIHTAQDVGDEPLLIYKLTRQLVVVHPDKVRAIKWLLSNYSDIQLIICDDGLQHLRLNRNYECVVFSKELSGNGKMIPAGPLRENIRYWDCTLHHQNTSNLIKLHNIIKLSNSKSFVVKREVQYVYKLSQPQNIMPIANLANKTALLLAGIANPYALKSTLENYGLNVILNVISDHANIKSKHFKHEQKFDIVIITEKDAVKYQTNKIDKINNNDNIWVVRLDIILDNNFIDDIYQLAHNK